MAHKKIVFVIVEGPSDQDALEVLLNKIFDKSRVHVHVTYGDITSEYGNNSSNILRKVTEQIKEYTRNYPFGKIHFQQVIHIIDMDGAYVPDAAVVKDLSATRPIYSEEDIRTADVTGIIKRNEVKRKNIDKLLITSKIWGSIPYAAYYMSCNLDHVLYNKLNSTDEDKERDSYNFAKTYKDNLDGFIKFITESDVAVEGDYKSTWEYIKTDKNSLKRSTNLRLCLPTENE